MRRYRPPAAVQHTLQAAGPVWDKQQLPRAECLLVHCVPAPPTRAHHVGPTARRPWLAHRSRGPGCCPPPTSCLPLPEGQPRSLNVLRPPGLFLLTSSSHKIEPPLNSLSDQCNTHNKNTFIVRELCSKGPRVRAWPQTRRLIWVKRLYKSVTGTAPSRKRRTFSCLLVLLIMSGLPARSW